MDPQSQLYLLQQEIEDLRLRVARLSVDNVRLRTGITLLEGDCSLGLCASEPRRICAPISRFCPEKHTPDSTHPALIEATWKIHSAECGPNETEFQ